MIGKRLESDLSVQTLYYCPDGFCTDACSIVQKTQRICFLRFLRQIQISVFRLRGRVCIFIVEEIQRDTDCPEYIRWKCQLADHFTAGSCGA